MLNKAYYSKILLIAVSAGAMASLNSGTALAGFEWVPGAPQAPVAKAPADTMQVKQAPVPDVSNEQLAPVPQNNPAHANEIIHVAPQAAQMAPPAPAAPDVMTPSPFDTPAPTAAPAPMPMQIAAPEQIETPAPVINTIDFTNKAPAPDEDIYYNENIEKIEAQTLHIEEEQVTMPAPTSQQPISIHARETQSPAEIIPVAQQPQQLAPTMPVEDRAPTRPVILAYPENPAQPTLATGAPVTQNEIYADAIGFGKDMPLALAIQQILPPGYAYSFAKSVNPGERVSWNGGKQWNLVLLETLKPLGLTARIGENNVAIVPSVGDLSSNNALSARETDSAIYAIEPASGVEQEIHTAPENDTETMSNRLIIRDPGEQETEQPGQSKSALLKPAENSVLIPINTSDITLNGDAPSLQKASMDAVGGNQKWNAKAGDSLKKVMYDWAKTADIQIIWEASHDYTLNTDFSSSEPVSVALANMMKSALANDAIPSYRIVNNNMKTKQMALIIVQDPPEAEMASSAPIAG